jgi:hypothetical protein
MCQRPKAAEVPSGSSRYVHQALAMVMLQAVVTRAALEVAESAANTSTPHVMIRHALAALP